MRKISATTILNQEIKRQQIERDKNQMAVDLRQARLYEIEQLVNLIQSVRVNGISPINGEPNYELTFDESEVELIKSKLFQLIHQIK